MACLSPNRALRQQGLVVGLGSAFAIAMYVLVQYVKHYYFGFSPRASR